MPLNSVTIDLCFCPDVAAARTDLASCVVVVIDVLRASATMCALVHQLPKRLHVCRDIESALVACNADHHSPAACVGERAGLAPQGFLSGNSPTEILETEFVGCHVYYATTNGTRMLDATSRAAAQLVGSFGNRHLLPSVIEALLAEHNATTLLLCCSGNEGGFSLEDSFFAGAFIQGYIASGESIILTDAAEAALCIAQAYNLDSLCMISHARHARILHTLGFSQDVAFCIAERMFNSVPSCRESIVSAFLS